MKVLKIDTNSKCVGNAWKDKNIGICVPIGLNMIHQEKQISLKSKNSTWFAVINFEKKDYGGKLNFKNTKWVNQFISICFKTAESLLKD